MRRNFYITVALTTFSLGFLLTDTLENFAVAFPLALIVLILLHKASSLKITLHHLKVTLLTLLIWIPFAALILNALPETASCVIDLPPVGTLKDGFIVTTEPNLEVYPVVSECYHNIRENVATNTIWAGIVNNKAMTKPAPHYPPLAKSARINSIVAVAVIIDLTGKVIDAEAISGHPLLRQAAIEAAYQARFEPTRICGTPLNVSGVLTYRFGL
jgi:TonB family protein